MLAPLILLLASLGGEPAQTASPQAAPPDEQRLAQDVSVCPLADGIWLHTTCYDLPAYGPTPANGLIIINQGNAIFINLPWKDEQTALLFDWVANVQHAKVSTVVPTHSHLDCGGGLAEAHRRGADSLALAKTAELMAAVQKPVPHTTFANNAVLDCGSVRIELAFIGAGHTVDNIVAWFPDKKILFGGCLIKSMEATGMGNTADADMTQWPKTLVKLKAAYPNASIVVPGHGKPGTLALIDHTLDMCTKANRDTGLTK